MVLNRPVLNYSPVTLNGLVVLKDSFLLTLTLGGCGHLERIDFGPFPPW